MVKNLKDHSALVKTRRFRPKGSWLLIKHNDDFVKKGYDAKDFPTSIRSGKTLDLVSKQK